MQSSKRLPSPARTPPISRTSLRDDVSATDMTIVGTAKAFRLYPGKYSRKNHDFSQILHEIFTNLRCGSHVLCIHSRLGGHDMNRKTAISTSTSWGSRGARRPNWSRQSPSGSGPEHRRRQALVDSAHATVRPAPPQRHRLLHGARRRLRRGRLANRGPDVLAPAGRNAGGLTPAKMLPALEVVCPGTTTVAEAVWRFPAPPTVWTMPLAVGLALTALVIEAMTVDIIRLAI